MLKVLGNLKNSVVSVVVIVILLCVQAATDLALPDYTSKIVNIGIQQSGIENPTPEQIRKSQMDKLLIFTDDDEKILDNYTLEGEIYKLNELDDQKQEELNGLMAEPLTELYFLTNKEMEKEILSNMSGDTANTQIKDMKLIDVIANLPEGERKIIIEKIDEKVSSLSGSTLEQSAINAIKEEYKIIGLDINKIQNDYIFISGLQMLGIALISMISAVIIMLLSSRVAARLGKTLRDKVFKKVLSFSTAELREFSTASLITRTTNDIQQIQMLITLLFRVVVYAPIIGIGGFIKVLTSSDNSMAWIIGVAIFGILVVVGTLFAISMPKFKKLQDLIDKLNQVSREILTGLPVIRAFNTEKKEENRFENSNKMLMKTNIFVNRAMSMMMPLLMFIMSSITVLIVWVGAHNVDSGTMQVGDMMTFIQYTMQIVMAFLMISMISIMLPRASVSARRINEVIETEPSIKDKENTKSFDPSKKGLVEFKNVSFRYPDADTEILEDINFTAEPGKTTALIGSTGSGKSTVVNLIPRFYDVTEGELLVDGVNVKDVPQKDLRDIIGFVPQKGILFSGSIESNIKYSDSNMSDETMIKAAQIAQAEEFIEGKTQKYKDPIAQGGANVSGGQKQRLSIARAIAKDPEIFIFDDSFSALDFKTDSELRSALAEKTENKTVIIVAQRISTILNADKIIVLEEGKIVGIGTHTELMKNNETYRQIALSQLSENELNEKGGK